MEITNAVLVTIMFVTILGIGIVNLLTALASIINQRDYSSLDRTMVSWIGLLLLIHLNVFWVTVTILETKDWRFSAFLFVLIGPMMLFFASQILVTNADKEIQTFSRVHLQAVARKFFSVLCLVMVWALAAMELASIS